MSDWSIDLIAELLAFREPRTWKDGRPWEFCHTPRELSRAIVVEAAELAELYQWGEEPAGWRAAEEIADVLIYCLYLCHAYGLEPERIIRDKIAKNEANYPVAGTSPAP